MTYEINPYDDRDEQNPEFTIDPVLSSSNTDYGGEDPAATEEITVEEPRYGRPEEVPY